MGSYRAGVRARSATRTLDGRRRGEGLGSDGEELSKQSDKWPWRELRRMRSPRLSAEPELVARESFEGARVEAKKQPGSAPAYRVAVGRGKGRRLAGRRKGGKMDCSG